MKNNYYSIHKNKSPKKIKYSKPYSKQQLKAMRELEDYFMIEVEKIKLKLVQAI